MNKMLSLSLQIADALSYYIPTFSEVFGECRIYDQ